MKEIYNVDAMVRKILAESPETRNSDSLLYVALCKKIYPNYSNLSAEEAMLNRKAYGIPKLSTVGRTRRKIQQHSEALRGTATVTDRRYENFKIVREYVQTED